MKSGLKGLVIFVIVLGSILWALYSGMFSSHPEPSSYAEPSSYPGPPLYPEPSDDLHRIFSIEIEYNTESLNKIQNIKGKYYTNTGKEVDPQLIYEFADSLTDLYEVEDYKYSYEDVIICEGEPVQITVFVHLANGEDIIMRSDKDIHNFCIYYCYIPWYVKYNGKLYAQYNGRIPTALMKILAAINVEWLKYEEKIHHGCYQEEVPEELLIKGTSPDFPQSVPVYTPEENTGKKYVLWEVDVKDKIIGWYADFPQYTNGSVCVATEHGMMWVDSQTGEKVHEIPTEAVTCSFSNGRVVLAIKDKLLCFDVQKQEKMWEFQFEQGEEYGCYYETFAVDKKRVYVSAKPSVLYCIDQESGNLLWKYQGEGESHPDIELSGRNLIVRTSVKRGKKLNIKMVCLDGETGSQLWEIGDSESTIHVRGLYDDVVIFRDSRKDSYVAVADIESGEIIWKKTPSGIGAMHYDDGLLYIDQYEECEVITLDLRTGKQVWSYKYNEDLRMRFLGDRILFLHYNAYFTDQWHADLIKLVLLDKNRSVLWEYHFTGDIEWDIFGHSYFALFEETLLFVRGKGLIQAFDAETGEDLWMNTIMGSDIDILDVYKGRVYLTADDGRLYCLDLASGKILWFFQVEKSVGEGGSDLFVSKIEDGLIFVATRRGKLFAFSLDELQSSIFLSSPVIRFTLK